MKYEDGTEVRYGDKVRIITNETALVVFSIDTNEYSDEFPKAQWEYLKKGVMVRTEKGALIHVEDWEDLELALVERKQVNK